MSLVIATLMMKMNGTLKRMKCFSFIFIRSDDIS